MKVVRHILWPSKILYASCWGSITHPLVFPFDKRLPLLNNIASKRRIPNWWDWTITWSLVRSRPNYCWCADNFWDPIPTMCLRIFHCRWRFYPLWVLLLWHSHPSGRQCCPSQLASCDCPILWLSYCGQHLGANCEDTGCLVPNVARQIDLGEQRQREHHHWSPWWLHDIAWKGGDQ